MATNVPTRLAKLALGALFLASVVVVAGGGCGSSGDDSGPGAEVAFHGEVDAFPGFKYDTGPQPPTGPVTVRLTLSAVGKLTGDASAFPSGSSSSPTMTGKAGSGAFAIDAHVKFDATLHASIVGKTYDGPVPGIEGLDVPIAGSTTFDPFLVGGQATVTANIPETKLPPIPLPGGIPGDLVITVLSDSTVTSVFSGVCAAATAGDPAKGSYTGKTTTSGKLVLKTSIVVHVPVTGDKTFDAPSPIDVPIPSINASMDLGTKDLTSFGSVPSPAGSTSTDTCGASDGGGVDGGGEVGDDTSTDGGTEGGTDSIVTGDGFTDGAGTGATGNACTADGDCDPSGSGGYFCGLSSPSPFCVQNGCSPVSSTSLEPCDGDKGVCLPAAGGAAYCIPVCTFTNSTTAPTGCLAGDSCNFLGYDPTSTTGAGYCLGGCQHDADCKAGRHCQPETLTCVPTLTTYTLAPGAACSSADGSDAKCVCAEGTSGNGYCVKDCIVGVTTCGSGTLCDPVLPSDFTSVPFSMAGMCLKTCTTDGDCTNSKCIHHGGMTQSTCDPNG